MALIVSTWVQMITQTLAVQPIFEWIFASPRHSHAGKAKETTHKLEFGIDPTSISSSYCGQNWLFSKWVRMSSGQCCPPIVLDWQLIFTFPWIGRCRYLPKFLRVSWLFLGTHTPGCPGKKKKKSARVKKRPSPKKTPWGDFSRAKQKATYIMTYVRCLRGGPLWGGGDVKSGEDPWKYEPNKYCLCINISGIAKKSVVVMIRLQLSRVLLSKIVDVDLCLRKWGNKERKRGIISCITLGILQL